MPNESNTEKHNDYVKKIITLFRRVRNTPTQEFELVDSCLRGVRRATAPGEDNKPKYFDICINHNSGHGMVTYWVECKTSERGSDAANDLKGGLIEFLQKAFLTLRHMEENYGGNYGFIFISNVPFGVSDKDITASYVKGALPDTPSSESAENWDKISRLATRVKILVFSDWYADLFGGE